MADVTRGPGPGAMPVPDAERGARAGLFVQFSGAALSLALLVGMGVWGYQLIMRDVNGIPVVRAMDGPMRLTPENPGGELALNTGLAVNEVVGQGEAAPPEELLILAPPTPDLTREDLLVQPTAEADEIVPDGVARTASPGPEAGAGAADEDAAIDLSRGEPRQDMTSEDVLALADEIAAASEPLTALSDTPVAAEDGAVGAEDTESDPTPVASAVAQAVADLAEAPEVTPEPRPVDLAAAETADGPGSALRPTARPAGLVRASASSPAAEPADSFAVSTEPVPEGTVLVQLGAFDSVELAGGEWRALAERFDEFMSSKDRLIQKAQSGGRDFYRLRATGFSDLDDARRFCSALVAEDAPCIPVVVR